MPLTRMRCPIRETDTNEPASKTPLSGASIGSLTAALTVYPWIASNGKGIPYTGLSNARPETKAIGERIKATLAAMPFEELLAAPLAEVRRLAQIEAPEVVHPGGVRAGQVPATR